MSDIYSKSGPELSWFEDFHTKQASKEHENNEDDLVICPKCGHENPVMAKFCEECGMALKKEVTTSKAWPRTMTCKSCGHVNPIHTKVCHDCGRNFHKGGKGGGKGGVGGGSKREVSSSTLATAIQGERGGRSKVTASSVAPILEGTSAMGNVKGLERAIAAGTVKPTAKASVLRGIRNDLEVAQVHQRFTRDRAREHPNNSKYQNEAKDAALKLSGYQQLLSYAENL